MVIAQLKNPKLYFMLFSDAVLVALAMILAYAVRFDFFSSADFTARYTSQIPRVVLVAVSVKLTLFALFGLYRGMWRFTGSFDLVRLFRAVCFASLILVGAIAYRYHFKGFSRSVFLIDAVLTFFLTGGLRVLIRIFYFRGESGFKALLSLFRAPAGRNILLVGAGDAAEKILREIEEDPRLDYQPVGLIDFDGLAKGRTLRGVPVVGGLHMIPRLVKKLKVQEILIIESASSRMIHQAIEASEASQTPFKMIPEMNRILRGDVSIKSLRDVNYEDLLGRPPVTLDSVLIQNCLEGRTILVSGAGGSIGAELCRQILQFRPERIILVENSEFALFTIENELKTLFGFDAAVPVLGAIQDAALMDQVFAKHNPAVVFHAAAYKHVPMLECNPWEAVSNNITGSYVLMQTAVKHNVERFVVVSTDKAVRPTNVMGASKRITELLMQGLNGKGTRFVAVRFGNVVGSSGSVVPVFRQQILRGGPVTVTHSDTTRYFMTIPEAAQLILQAGALGEGGEIFVLRMGTPVKIIDMARDLIRLSGKEPDTDITIEITGLRPGEKLHEELMHQDENIVPTRYPEIMMLRNNGGELADQLLNGGVAELQQAALTRDAGVIKQALKTFVSEYEIQDSMTVLVNCGG